MAKHASSEQVLALQMWRWLLGLGVGWVFVLFISFVLIYVSQALITTHIARVFNGSGFLSFMGFVLVLFYS